MTFDAVIFDLDGTVLDTLPDLADSLNAALTTLGLPTHELSAVRPMVGGGIRRLIRMSLPPSGDSWPDHELEWITLTRFKNEYRRRQFDKTAPYPGMLDLLKALSLQGVRLAVLSNKDHENTSAIIERFFPGLFQVTIGARPDLPLKPDPSGALEVLAALGTPKERTLYVGDSGVDMLTAKAAGLKPIGVSWGFRPAAELKEAGAERVVDSPSELWDFMGEPS